MTNAKKNQKKQLTSDSHRISLHIKISLIATALILVSFTFTGIVTGIKSSETAENSSINQAKTAAREAANALNIRLSSNVAAISELAAVMISTKRLEQPLQRPQIDEIVKETLSNSTDFIGAAVTWEPNALDGKDSEFANKSPIYDASGRHMPYWTKTKTSEHHVEPIVFGSNPEANEWYETPRKTKLLHFTEPYNYPINGQEVMMASIVAPIIVNGQFLGTASADFSVEQLKNILEGIKVIPDSNLALISNKGVYATNSEASHTGKPASDLPDEGLLAIKKGAQFQYEDSNNIIHILQPVLIHKDIPPWSIKISFKRSTAISASTDLMRYILSASVICAFVTISILLILLSRLFRPLKSLNVAMQGLASGNADLRTKITIKSNDELGIIATNFNVFIGKINDVLLEVRGNADIVASTSSQIAQGNNDLSSRTESQATALEETSASMKQLNEAVKQNALSAKTANSLALEASTVARNCGQVVGEVVKTMQEIQDSSHKIADITAVIDSIAFQTNILALNAAVEAARAGEQGRGFAVVATEVRSLAGRSANAAKEIKQLIGLSVERVEHGTTQVAQAGHTMNEVVRSIGRVADFVGEISSASEEQSLGVSQINDAIASMDQTTQQNAALVEEMAAAANSLKQQASELVNAVDGFGLVITQPIETKEIAVQIAEQPRLDSNVLKISNVPLKQKITTKRDQRITPNQLDKDRSKSKFIEANKDEWENF
ncbi:methyl-accepting chemotaxis protein [Rhodoferax mekongensis]|uniref:Methyl-accepting chemotaxis protein n=1 Tax=Rhodoferax mekongensis TaxID=3068341 RepID=A0ABZ0AWC7_9BURK|nr:methyl-accepting chemotaxis protein [Rhodoferax sp. TBRC 17307]WNO03952.1 methyl-accepting chemotaxis protein [Rhodoferax sp. TBRC 17307]